MAPHLHPSSAEEVEELTSRKQRQDAHDRHRMRAARAGRNSPGNAPRPGISDDEWREVLRHHYQRRRRQKLWGWVAIGVAALVALNHFLEHVDTLALLNPVLSPSWQDVVAGYPVAIVLVLAGVMLLGQSDEPPARHTLRPPQ